MEFTKLLKYGSASLFLILVAHGLFRGFTNSTTIISIALLAVCFTMEQFFNLSERAQFQKEFKRILTENRESIDQLIEHYESVVKNLNDEYKANQEDVMKKIEFTHSQINTMKMGSGMTSLRRNV
jgi:phage host-nuclease inhibitor protein Gam